MKNSIFILMLFLIAISCNDDEPDVDPKGSIFISVRHNFDIVAGAQISTEPVTGTATTDLTGSGIISDVPIGGYKVNATHPDIGSGSASVTVVANQVMDVNINLIGGVFINPIVAIQSPTNFSAHNTGEDIQFTATVSDEADALNTLDLTWSSSLDGVLNTEPANSSGLSTFTSNTLSEGEHVITLRVKDSDDLESIDQITITVAKLPDPVQLSPITVSSSGLELDWTISMESEFENYKVTRSENPDGPFQVINVISNLNAINFTDSNVQFGNRYYYQIIVALNDGTESKSNIESQLFEGDNIDVGVNIERMILDPERPYIYALDKINNSLLFINKESKMVEKTIFVGSSPTDIDINLDNSKAFVANYGSTQIAIIDLESQEKTNDIFVDTEAGTWDGNPYRLACLTGNKLAFTSEDQHNNIKVVNASNGSMISVNNFPSVYQPGLITNSDQDILFATESGTTGSEAVRFNFDGSILTSVSSSNSETNFTGYRDGCISDDDKYIFFNGNKLLTNNLESNLGTFSEWIFDCSSDGSIAIGEENIWNANNFSIIKTLPISSSVIRLDHDDNTIYIYDKNTSKIFITTVQ